MAYPLEPSSEELRRVIDRAAERLTEHVASLPEQPASYDGGGEELARSLAEATPPERGAPLPELLDLLFDRALSKTYNTAGPGYLAYIPGGGVVYSAVAELLANGINRYSGVWVAAPGLVQLELNVVRWFCRMVGYPEGSLGFLTSGGSLANFTGIVTARCERLGEEFLDGTMYAGDQIHHSVAKAARMAGVPARNVVTIESDAGFRIRPDRLEEAIRRDRDAGKRPFLIVASAGTTNTGAVDDLTALADLAAREGLWLHVDAAYGGFFALTERGRRVLAGLERADSVTLDPHKGLFLPYGSGCLLVRDGDTLRRTHSIDADYMPTLQDEADLVDICQISPELSRDFRGLRVWLPLKLLGLEPFRQALDEKADLAEWATAELRKIDDMEIVAPPQLSTVAFRLRPVGWGAEETNRLNRELMARVNERRRVFLTATTLDGLFTLRICVLNFRTHQDRMEACMEDLRAALAEVREGTAAAE